MPKLFKGKMEGKGKRFGIVAARFNEFITSKLIDGAIDALVRHNVLENDIDIFWVPGAFEIPSITKKLINTKRYDAIICLGCVIRGSTPHFEYIASEVSKGIALTALDSSIPVIFGVLTTDNIEQAMERAGTKAGNKGADAAMSALEMIDLYAQIK